MSDDTGLEEVLESLESWEEAIRGAVKRVSESIADLVQEYARTHHIWQSATGDTDDSTTATVTLQEDVFEIVLTAGTDYARFLELARAGRWAWLWEAISANEEAIRSLLVSQLREVRL